MTLPNDTNASVRKSARWSCDVFTGTADALIVEGIVTPEELKPQEGRPEWRMAFLPNGEPCPPSRKAWREPGYKAIWRLADGTYQVEVTVPRDVQASRRKANEEAAHEREQFRINKEVEESGNQYRNWKLQHGFTGLPGGYESCGRASEWWEGTKAQLQSIGIGVGMVFPGEPDGPEELQCKCPLGFDVRVYLPSGYDRAKTAAGIYSADSPYIPYREEEKQFVQYAPGVMLEVWTPEGWRRSDIYYGTAAALVAAGLVPSVDHFPGSIGRNKMQASYDIDWRATPSSPHRKVRLTIKKRGKANQFIVEVPVSKDEEARRDEVRKQRHVERKKLECELAIERQRLRQLSSGTTLEEFRVKRERELETWMQLLWSSVFTKSDGLLSYDLAAGSDGWRELAEAFQTLREAVREAPVRRDAELEAKLVTRKKLTAARNDEVFQSMLQAVKHTPLPE